MNSLDVLLPRVGLTDVALTIYCEQFSNRKTSFKMLIELVIVGIETL